MDPSNLRPAHNTCNSKRGSQLRIALARRRKGIDARGNNGEQQQTMRITDEDEP
jgi:hypothetical protein